MRRLVLVETGFMRAVSRTIPGRKTGAEAETSAPGCFPASRGLELLLQIVRVGEHLGLLPLPSHLLVLPNPFVAEVLSVCEVRKPHGHRLGIILRAIPYHVRPLVAVHLRTQSSPYG